MVVVVKTNHEFSSRSLLVSLPHLSCALTMQRLFLLLLSSLSRSVSFVEKMVELAVL